MQAYVWSGQKTNWWLDEGKGRAQQTAQEDRDSHLKNPRYHQGEHEYKPILITRPKQKVYMSVPDLSEVEKDIEETKISAMLKDYEDIKKVSIMQ